MKMRAFFALLTLAILSACHPDQSDTEKNLTAGIWLEDEHWLDEDGDGVLTIYPYLDDCNKDDEYRFEPGGSFKFNDGSNLCEPDFPISISGNWELRNNDTELHISVPPSNDALDYKIGEISENRCVLNRIFPDAPTAKLPYEKIVLRK